MRQNLAEVVNHHSDALETSTKIVNACADAKAKNITVLDASKVSDFCNYFVIASGHSDRQVQGICNRIVEELSLQGLRPLSVEGLDTGHWVVLDFGEVLAHVFYEPVRGHYDLEGLWARAPHIEIKRQRRGALRLKVN